LEAYLAKQRRLKARVPLKKQLIDAMSSRLKITVGDNSIYVWKSRRFEELIYMHLPRMFFLGASCYVIYRINLKQQEAKRWKEGVKSHRQEDISKQIGEISRIIGTTQNQFEPNKNVQYDRSYSGDQYKYSYEATEKDLQEKLFKIYEEMEEEAEA
jgi:hypothetical protein